MLRSAFAHFGDDTSGFASGLQELLELFAPRRVRLHIYGRPHPFGYGGQVRELPLQWALQIVARFAARSDRLAGWSTRAIRVLQVLAIGLRHQGVLLGSGRGITAASWELRLYRALGVRIITVLHGSDARPVFLNGARLHQLGVSHRLLGKHRSQLEMCHRVSRWSDEIVAYPAIAHYFGRRMADRCLIGWPRVHDPSQRPGASPDASSRVAGSIRILHAPSNPAIKGSDRIAELVEGLQRQGFDVVLQAVTGLTNEQIQQEIERCDFAIDQLWADLSEPIFALEVAHSGRSVVVGSAHADWLEQRYAATRPEGIILVEPASVPTIVERLTEEAVERRHNRDHGIRGVEEAGRVESGPTQQAALAERWVALLQGRLAEQYFFNPCDIEPLFFGFAPEEVIRSAAASFCREFNVEPPFSCASHRAAFAQWIGDGDCASVRPDR